MLVNFLIPELGDMKKTLLGLSLKQTEVLHLVCS